METRLQIMYFFRLFAQSTRVLLV